MRRVLLRQGREFQSQSVARLTMPHDALDPDLAFLDQKIEPGFRAYRLWTCGSNEQTSRAQVPDACDIIDTVTTPIDPHAVRRLDPRGMPPRIGRCLRRGLHNAPWALHGWRTNRECRLVENYSSNLWKTREDFRHLLPAWRVALSHGRWQAL